MWSYKVPGETADLISYSSHWHSATIPKALQAQLGKHCQENITSSLF